MICFINDTISITVYFIERTIPIMICLVNGTISITVYLVMHTLPIIAHPSILKRFVMSPTFVVIPVIITVITRSIMMLPAMTNMISIETLMIPVMITIPVPPMVMKIVVMYPIIAWGYRKNIIRRKICNIRWRCLNS